MGRGPSSYRRAVMPTRVLLVRHGQSEWNAVGRWQGQADPPLTDLGRAAGRGRRRTRSAPSTRSFASDLQRAAETAAIIAGELGVGPVVLDPDLRERDAGEWSGLTRAEIEERCPGYLEARRPTSTPAFGRRAQAARAGRRAGSPTTPCSSGRWRALAAHPRRAVGGGDVLAVTHGGLIYVARGPPRRAASPAWPTAGAGGSSVDGDRARPRRPGAARRRRRHAGHGPRPDLTPVLGGRRRSRRSLRSPAARSTPSTPKAPEAATRRTSSRWRRSPT